ncbi:exocyst complex component exo84 [Blastocladiella emersonii ATCC 22665]|nr:exocyst complex component exo84 [Blastocladiella emersonii ATCC 22665]
MADTSPSPTVPRRDRDRARGAGVAEARAALAGAAGSSTTNSPAPGSSPATPPKKSDARRAAAGAPGHKRDKSWAAKFGSGNWKSLTTGGGSGGGSEASPTNNGGGSDRRGGPAEGMVAGLRKFSLGAGDGSRSRGPSGGAFVEIDQQRFLDEAFDPNEYILSALHSNTEEGVRNFYRRLVDARDGAANDLKANVYKNYSEFVVISKEISQLETDMLVLCGLLSDMRSVHENFRVATGIGGEDGNGSSENLASSQMQLNSAIPVSEAARAGGAGQREQLQLMYDTVENAAKAMPANANRILVHTGSLIELDAQFRFKSSVQVYLLNDFLFVAAKRRRGIKSKFVADKCWSLNEITVLDVRDTPDVSCAFKVVRNATQFVFRCDAHADKKMWLQLIKRQIEDWGGGGSGGGGGASGAAARLASGQAGQQDGTGSEVGSAVDRTSRGPASPTRPPRQLNAKELDAKVQDQLDDLDVYIASRDFDRALDLVRALKSTAPAHLPPRVQLLSTALLRDLTLNGGSGSKRPVLKTLHRLIQLGQTAQARDAFLAVRGTVIRDAGRAIRFQGDLAAYVRELGHVVVAGIHTTAEWYREAIPEPAMASFLAQWAKDQLHELARACVRQVGDESLAVIIACLEASVDHIRTLRAIGLDLEFVFWNGVQENVAKAIEVFERQCAELVARSIIEDTFDPIKNDYNDGITRSMMQFCKTMLDFLTHTKFFHGLQAFQSQITGCISGLFEAFVNWQLQVFREKPLEPAQKAAVVANLKFTIQLFLAKVVNQVEKQYKAKVPALAALRTQLSNAVREAGSVPGFTPPSSAPLSRSPSGAAMSPTSPRNTGNAPPPSDADLPRRPSAASSGGGGGRSSHARVPSSNGGFSDAPPSPSVNAEPGRRPRRPTRDRSNPEMQSAVARAAARFEAASAGSVPNLAASGGGGGGGSAGGSHHGSGRSSPQHGMSRSASGSHSQLSPSGGSSGSISRPRSRSPFADYASLFHLGRLARSPSDPNLGTMLPSRAVRRFVASHPTEALVHRVLSAGAATGVPAAAIHVSSVTQLVLDIHYLLKRIEVEGDAAEVAQELCERGLRAYLEQNGDPGMLRGGDFYEERADLAMARDAR